LKERDSGEKARLLRGNDEFFTPQTLCRGVAERGGERFGPGSRLTHNAVHGEGGEKWRRMGREPDTKNSFLDRISAEKSLPGRLGLKNLGYL